MSEAIAAQMDEDELDKLPPSPRKIHWLNRLGYVEALAAELADNGGKWDRALRAVRVQDYCINAKRMTGKQAADVKREAKALAADLRLYRQAAQVGDVVRVLKLELGPLGYHVKSRKPIDAEVVARHTVSGVIKYKVRRLDDGGLQDGNGHMIKSIVRRADKEDSKIGEHR